MQVSSYAPATLQDIKTQVLTSQNGQHVGTSEEAVAYINSLRNNPSFFKDQLRLRFLEKSSPTKYTRDEWLKVWDFIDNMWSYYSFYPQKRDVVQTQNPPVPRKYYRCPFGHQRNANRQRRKEKPVKKSNPKGKAPNWNCPAKLTVKLFPDTVEVEVVESHCARCSLDCFNQNRAPAFVKKTVKFIHSSYNVTRPELYKILCHSPGAIFPFIPRGTFEKWLPPSLPKAKKEGEQQAPPGSAPDTNGTDLRGEALAARAADRPQLVPMPPAKKARVELRDPGKAEEWSYGELNNAELRPLLEQVARTLGPVEWIPSAQFLLCYTEETLRMLEHFGEVVVLHVGHKATDLGGWHLTTALVRTPSRHWIPVAHFMARADAGDMVASQALRAIASRSRWLPRHVIGDFSVQQKRAVQELHDGASVWMCTRQLIARLYQRLPSAVIFHQSGGFMQNEVWHVVRERTRDLSWRPRRLDKAKSTFTLASWLVMMVFTRSFDDFKILQETLLWYLQEVPSGRSLPKEIHIFVMSTLQSAQDWALCFRAHDKVVMSHITTVRTLREWCRILGKMLKKPISIPATLLTVMAEADAGYYQAYNMAALRMPSPSALLPHLCALPQKMQRRLFNELLKVTPRTQHAAEVDECLSWKKYGVPCKHRLAAHMRGTTPIPACVWDDIWFVALADEALALALAPEDLQGLVEEGSGAVEGALVEPLVREASRDKFVSESFEKVSDLCQQAHQFCLGLYEQEHAGLRSPQEIAALRDELLARMTFEMLAVPRCTAPPP